MRRESPPGHRYWNSPRVTCPAAGPEPGLEASRWPRVSRRAWAGISSGLIRMWALRPSRRGWASTLPYVGKIGGEAHEQFLAQIGVRDFAPAELHHGLHAIAFRQEADGVVHLEVVVVVVGVGAELQFLHLDHVLLLLGVVLLLFLVVLCSGRSPRPWRRAERRWAPPGPDRGPIPALCAGRRGGHHFGGAVGKDRAHFTRANGLIYVLSAILPARRKVSAWIHLSDSFEFWEVSGYGPNALRDALMESRNGANRRQALFTSVSVYTNLPVCAADLSATRRWRTGKPRNRECERAARAGNLASPVSPDIPAPHVADVRRSGRSFTLAVPGGARPGGGPALWSPAAAGAVRLI